MTKQTEALKLALEALEEARTNDDSCEKWDRNKEAITAVKEALAQPEQLVAHREAFWCVDLTCKKCYGADFRFKHKSSVDKKFLTTPAQPDAFEQGRQEGMKQERALWELSRVGQEIEAQPVQPVSWTGNGSAERRKINAPTGFFFQVDKRLEEDDDIQDYKKPWVGLTIYEMDDAFDESMKVRPKEASNAETRRLFAHAIEAKLKAVNGFHSTEKNT